MKKILFSFLILSGIVLAGSANAQMRVDVGVRDNHPDYYYLPDVDMYYYIPANQYVYLYDDHWVFSNHLPPRYHDYDFAHGRRIYVYGIKPYLHHDVHYEQYNQHGNGHGNGYGYSYGNHGNGHGGGHSNRH